MEFSDDPLLYTEYRTPSLLIYRKLYRRTTDIQNGLVIFSFREDKLKSELVRPAGISGSAALSGGFLQPPGLAFIRGISGRNHSGPCSTDDLSVP